MKTVKACEMKSAKMNVLLRSGRLTHCDEKL